MRPDPGRLARAALLVALLASAACTGPLGPQPTDQNGPVGSFLTAVPPDVSTGLDSLEVDVTFQGGPPPSAVTTQALILGGTLATWPDLVPLATTEGAQGLDVAFSSAEPAPDGWYALVVSKAPARTTLGGTFHRLADGRAIVRVRVGSAPMLRALSLCPKADGRTAIVAEFSEAVGAAMAFAPPFTIAAGPASSPTPCMTDQQLAAGATRGSFELVCPSSLAPTDVVALSFADGLVSDSGVGVPIGQRTFTVQTFRPNLVMTECSSLLFEP